MKPQNKDTCCQKKTAAFWKYGDQRRICEQLQITSQALGDILHRRTGVGIRRAMALAKVTSVPVMDWLLNKESKHPAFFGEPQKN